MRTLALAALAAFLAAEAFAQAIDAPRSLPDFRERLNACAAEWTVISARERGTMSYRQFTTKCLEGKRALPIDTVAACRNGTTSPATASEGACAYDGGVERWLE